MRTPALTPLLVPALALALAVTPALAACSPAGKGAAADRRAPATAVEAPLQVRPVVAIDVCPARTPGCDPVALAAVDCDAEPVPAPPERPAYLCQDARTSTGSGAGTPDVRYALAPARIVGGVLDATYGIPAGSDGYAVTFQLDTDAADELAALSEEYVNPTGDPAGEFVALVLDGRVLSAPYFTSVILDGAAQIDGDFTEAEARELAEAVRAGG